MLAVVLAVLAAGCSSDPEDPAPESGGSPGPSGASSGASSAATPDDTRSGGASVPPPATGEVDAPSPGTGTTVPPEEQQPPLEVGSGQAGPVQPGVRVRLGALTRVDAEAAAPGEVSGPAVQVEVVADNATDAEATLAAVVALSYGPDQTPAPLFAGESTPLPAVLAPGDRASAVYVFAVPADYAALSVLVSSGGNRPLVFSETL
ncbi:hypothetical protein [Nocardioides sp. GXZ039]|uniref:hypothetical protein n=1 Tax=Nocardioides sp. GXZ039 TaxID=3136018 RepID=UPI0030F41192